MNNSLLHIDVKTAARLLEVHPKTVLKMLHRNDLFGYKDSEEVKVEKGYRGPLRWNVSVISLLSLTEAGEYACEIIQELQCERNIWVNKFKRDDAKLVNIRAQLHNRIDKIEELTGMYHERGREIEKLKAIIAQWEEQSPVVTLRTPFEFKVIDNASKQLEEIACHVSQLTGSKTIRRRPWYTRAWNAYAAWTERVANSIVNGIDKLLNW